MLIKFFLLFLFLYNNSVFAESYIKNLEIINDTGKLVQYHVEIAKTNEEQTKGLMHRLDLKKNGGMLFLFDTEKKASFWMKDTLIALDIIFINKNGSINKIHNNTRPKSLKRIKSKGEVLAVLEINAGEAIKNNIGYRSFIDLEKFISSY
ncbi:MAG: hypothetical protein CML89_06240 [Rhodobiaceae bacterium]|nr:hypothetical protein [Rhodobiaceae bacterium]